MDNVRLVVNDRRCMSCGACCAICPTEAIEMVYKEGEGFYRPVINDAKCIRCGKCVKSCPAEHQKNSDLMGEFQALYLAHSTNATVRHWATSGGVINALVCYLLDKKLVDGVLMTGYSKDSPVEAQAFWITYNDVSTLKEKPRDFASRYVAVPILEKMKEVSGMTSIAVIGTSCQTTALKIMGGGTRDLNIFRIGITCSGGMSYKATKEYKRVQNLQSAKMFYRGDGWPGKNSLVTDTVCVNAVHSGSLYERMFSSQIFKNPGCRYCKDHFAENADISFCDFWNKDELATEREGNSCVIVRTQRAQELIQKMQDDNYIEVVRNLEESEIEAGQMHVLRAKKGDPYKALSYQLFLKAIDFVFNHQIYRLFGLKTYQRICRVYNKIISRIIID